MNEYYHKQRNQKLSSLTAGIFVARKKKDFRFIIIQEVYREIPRFIAILDKQFTIYFTFWLYLLS